MDNGLKLEIKIRNQYGYTTRYQVINSKTQEIYTYGVMFGTHEYIFAQTEHFLIMHVPAHKSWCGVALPWETSPTTYYLCRHWIDNGQPFLVPYAEIQPGGNWRQARKILIDEMNKLEGEYGQ